MIKRMRERAAGESGQGMSEYIITVALIGIASIGIVGLFGDNVRLLFGASADALAGNENADPNAQHAPTLQHRTLANFGDTQIGGGGGGDGALGTVSSSGGGSVGGGGIGGGGEGPTSSGGS